MSAVDTKGAVPEARSPHFVWLLFGACAAPIFWLGQLMLSYAISAAICYPDDTPRMTGPGSLSVLLMVFDAIALAASLGGGAISLSGWLRTRGDGEDNRSRFLALWGMMSSLWFFFAILFNAIASVLAPLCGE
jgi:hypothetical protein